MRPPACLLLLPAAAAGGDNGVGITPPMGWRSWNFFRGDISQGIMQQQMAALAARERPVVGRGGNSSLLDVGYTRAGIDDAWQACGAGVHGAGAKTGGFHDASGRPLVNLTKFPDMKGLVDFGHARGLQVGWYDNNCICGEGAARLSAQQVETDVEGNVRFITEMGFDGLKADGCGPGKDMHKLAALLNATGRHVLVENCHYDKATGPMPAGAPPDSKHRIFPYWKGGVAGGELVCPENTFRAGGDIGNHWGSWFSELGALAEYQDPVHPISQPGCWAYADMLMVGVAETPQYPGRGAAASAEEWRSHFGGWVINSSPLILTFDLTASKIMDQVWPFITNLEAIAVNQAWAGHPGRLVKDAGDHKIWSKPLPNGSVAALVVNMQSSGAVDVEIELAALSAGLPAAARARDVWAHTDAGAAAGGRFAVAALAPHDSRLLVFAGGAGPAPPPAA